MDTKEAATIDQLQEEVHAAIRRAWGEAELTIDQITEVLEAVKTDLVQAREQSDREG